MKHLLLLILTVTQVMSMEEIAGIARDFSVKKLYEKSNPVYGTYEGYMGLSGVNSHQKSNETFQTTYPGELKNPRQYLTERTSKGWVVLSKKSHKVVHVSMEDEQVYWQYDLRKIVKEDQFYVEGMRYENGILYFNAACRSYSKEQRGKCSTLYAYDTTSDTLLWHSDYLISNSSFILTEKLVVAGYGFTAEPDYLYFIRKSDGKVLKRVKLKTAHRYLEMVGSQLHVICYDHYYLFELRGY